MKAQGVDVISLSLGEPDFNTPDEIKEAGKKAIDENYTKYPPVPGYADLRQAVSDKFKQENNLDYSPDQVVVSAGGKHSLINILLSIVNPGEEVILLAPYWVSYYEQIILAEGKPVVINTTIDNDFKATAEEIEAVITPKTRAIIFNSPSNPTGMVYTREEMKRIAAVIAKHPGIIMISDEIYEHIVFDGKHESMGQFPEIFDQTVIVNGVSKGYCMTGWRIGYIGAPLWLARACSKLQGQFTSGVSSIAQRAALAALKSDPQTREDMRVAFQRRRDLVVGLLREIEGVKVSVPQGAFYLFPDMSYFLGKKFEGKTIENSQDLAMYLLEEGHVATVAGSAFGSPDCLRLSYAASDEELTEAVRRMKVALEKLS